MNKHCFRIVFNARRGQRMVVSERTPSFGCTSRATTCLSNAVAIGVMVSGIALNAQAQIVANANAPKTQQPTIFSTANGVPQVNIQTPSAAGVSRNNFSQFDVQSKGVILNNSQMDVQTQQAGWVQANPWLVKGTAKVILNEVNSPNPSQINGYIEVAGARADVVVANPAGINVNGGGFINASQGILTTGTPVFNSQGGIDSYRVQGGQVTIDGAGLDMRTTDYGAILARAVQVNAGIWANELKVVLGANQIDAASLAVNTVPIATPISPAVSSATGGTNTTPTYALDVAAIGGMYAGKIFLVGTEAGLGVRNAGTLSANATTGGDLVLNHNGWLSNSGIVQAKGNAQITTQGDTLNAGMVYADGNQSLSVTGQFENTASGTLSSLGDTSILATADMTNRGGINGNTTRIASANLTNMGTGRIYGDHLAISTGALTNDAETVNSVKTSATIAARKRLDMGIQALDNTNDAWIYSDGDIVIGAALDVNNQAVGRAQRVTNNGSTITSAKNMQITAQDIQNLNRDLAYEKVVIKDVVTTPGASFDSEYVTNSGVYSGDQSMILNSASSGIVRWRGYRPAILWSSSGGRLFVLPSDSPNNTPEDKALYKTDPAVRAAMDAQGALVQLWREYKTDQEVLQVKESHPGRMTSGQDMTLNASQTLLNDMSQIVAGGAINVSGVNVENRQRTENVTDTRKGMSYNWEHQDEGCGNWKGCSWELDAYWGGYYNESINKTFTLSLASTKQNQSVSTDGVNVAMNSVFQTPTNPAATYLMETDPLFSKRKQWLGSDYLFTALNLSPASTQKRLGDGFYEQKLIREQVASLTGKRFLGDFTSDAQQFQALMDNATTVAKTFNLRPGIALTEAQVAQLTSDIVWLVSQTVTLPDGSVTQAWVPQVYVRPRAGDLSTDGALISGTEVSMQLSGNLNNQGTIAGRKVVNLAANNIDNLNRIVSDTVNLSATQDINVIGGSVQAQREMNVIAGRDVNMQSTTYSGGSVDRRNSLQGVERIAGLYVGDQGASGGTTGQLSVKAGQDINLVAATLRNSGKGDTDLDAGKTIALKTLTENRSVEAGSLEDHQYVKADQSKELGSTVQGGSNVTLKATDIHARASILEAGTDNASPTGTLRLTAQNNVTIESGQSTQNFFAVEKQVSHGGLAGTDKETITSRVSSNTAVQTSNLIGKESQISAGNNLMLTSSNVVGDNAVSLSSGNTIALTAQQNTLVQGVSQQTIEKGPLDGLGVGFTLDKSKSEERALKSTNIGSTLQSNEKIDINVGHLAFLEGAQVNAKTINLNQTDPSKAGQVILSASVDTTQKAHSETHETAGMWQAQSGNGEVKQSANATQLNGQININGNLQMTVQLGIKPGQSVSEQVNTLSQLPGLGYLKDLQNNPKVNWQSIELASKEWSYSQEGLTPAGAALVAIAVAIATTDTTGSLAASISGGTSGASYSAMQAAMSAATSQAAVMLANNGGDIGKTLQDMGKAENIKGFVTTAITAGTLQTLNPDWMKQLNATGQFTDKAVINLTNAAVSATIKTAIQGGSYDANLLKNLKTAGVDTAAGWAASNIGEGYKSGEGTLSQLQEQYIAHKVAHALVGCASAAAKDSSCAAGAIGGAVGEAFAEMYGGTTDGSTLSSAKQHEVLNMSKLVAAAVAGLTGKDAQAAVDAAQNAVLNNFLFAKNKNELKKVANSCEQTGDAVMCARRDSLTARDIKLDRLRDQYSQEQDKSKVKQMISAVSTLYQEEFDRYGIDVNSYLLTMANIESKFDISALNKATNTQGLYQFTGSLSVDSLFVIDQSGKTIRLDPVWSTAAAAQYTLDNIEKLKKMGITKLTPEILYAAHQQGAGGVAALIKNPDINAVNALLTLPVYREHPEAAVSAVINNGGKITMSADDFMKMWAMRYSAELLK